MEWSKKIQTPITSLSQTRGLVVRAKIRLTSYKLRHEIWREITVRFAGSKFSRFAHPL